MDLRGCADRLATFHICQFCERSNRLLIAHWHIRYPPIRASSKEEVIDVIRRKLPEVSTVVQMISTVIERKSTKLSAYEHGLSQLNLIILDHSNRLITTAADHFYRHFFTSEVRKVLANTGFREVYFITTLEREKKVYIPLKALFWCQSFICSTGLFLSISQILSTNLFVLSLSYL